MTCYALIVIYVLQLLVSTHYLNQSVGLRLKELVLNNLNSFAVTVISMVAPFLCYAYLPAQFSPTKSLLIGATTCVLSWLLGIFAVRHPICTELTSLLGNRRQRQSGSVQDKV